MIVFLCDKCQKIISEAELRNNSTRKKNGEVVCGECSVEQKNSREVFTCDRCNKKHSLDLLRTGKATLIKGKLYCHRCREFAEKKSRELLDFRYLSVIFIVFLGIPMMIGSSMWLYHYIQNVSASGNSETQNNISREELRSLIEETIRNNSRPQKENIDDAQDVSVTEDNNKSVEHSHDKTANKKAKSIGALLDELGKNQKNKQPSKPKKTNAIAKKFSELTTSIRDSVAAKMNSDDEATRITGIMQVMKSRERSCIDLLNKALEDKSPLVRSFAAKALGALGANKSISKLLSSVSDPNRQVRRSIAQALTMLTGRGFKDHQDLSDEDKRKLIEFINKE